MGFKCIPKILKIFYKIEKSYKKYTNYWNFNFFYKISELFETKLPEYDDFP